MVLVIYRVQCDEQLEAVLLQWHPEQRLQGLPHLRASGQEGEDMSPEIEVLAAKCGISVLSTDTVEIMQELYDLKWWDDIGTINCAYDVDVETTNLGNTRWTPHDFTPEDYRKTCGISAKVYDD